MHYKCISPYAGFGTYSKLSNFWEASDSLWVEPLLQLINTEREFVNRVEITVILKAINSSMNFRLKK